jgi:hypothetical protein
MAKLTITKLDAHNNVVDRKVKFSTQICEPAKYAAQRLEWSSDPKIVKVRVRNEQGLVLAEASR